MWEELLQFMGRGRSGDGEGYDGGGGGGGVGGVGALQGMLNESREK